MTFDAMLKIEFPTLYPQDCRVEVPKGWQQEVWKWSVELAAYVNEHSVDIWVASLVRGFNKFQVTLKGKDAQEKMPYRCECGAGLSPYGNYCPDCGSPNKSQDKHRRWVITSKSTLIENCFRTCEECGRSGDRESELEGPPKVLCDYHYVLNRYGHESIVHRLVEMVGELRGELGTHDEGSSLLGAAETLLTEVETHNRHWVKGYGYADDPFKVRPCDKCGRLTEDGICDGCRVKMG